MVVPARALKENALSATVELGTTVGRKFAGSTASRSRRWRGARAGRREQICSERDMEQARQVAREMG